MEQKYTDFDGLALIGIVLYLTVIIYEENYFCFIFQENNVLTSETSMTEHMNNLHSFQVK